MKQTTFLFTCFFFFLPLYFLIVTNKDNLDDVVSMCGSQSRSVLIAIDPRTKIFFFFFFWGQWFALTYMPLEIGNVLFVFRGQEFLPRFMKSKSDITVTDEE